MVSPAARCNVCNVYCVLSVSPAVMFDEIVCNHYTVMCNGVTWCTPFMSPLSGPLDWAVECLWCHMSFDLLSHITDSVTQNMISDFAKVIYSLSRIFLSRGGRF